MISTRFDTLFSSLSGGLIPTAFLRVLSFHESSLNPDAVTPSSHATGLFQTTQTVIDEYNLHHGTKHTLEDAKDPTLSTKIGTELLAQIVSGYRKNHPRSLATNWADPRFIGLLVAGFNAGYSERGGVGKVVGELERAGIPAERITVDTVAQAAKSAGASKYLSQPDRLRYWKAVTASYLKEIAKTEPEVIHFVIPPKGREDKVYVPVPMGNIVALMLLPLGAIFWANKLKKKRKKSWQPSTLSALSL